MQDGLTRWRRVADALREDIGAGRPAPGEALATEEQLAARFGVNRHTVRRALASLAAEGRVRARRGSGTFVTDAPVPYRLAARTRFTAFAEGAGLGTTAELLGEARVPAEPDLAARLELAPGTALVRFATRRAVGGRWAGVAVHWLEAARFDGLARGFREHGSLSAAFAALGVADYRRARSDITALAADEETAERLGVDPGAPVLFVRALDVDVKGRPLQVVETQFAPQVITLVVDTAADGPVLDGDAGSADRRTS